MTGLPHDTGTVLVVSGDVSSASPALSGAARTALSLAGPALLAIGALRACHDPDPPGATGDPVTR